MKQTVDDAWQIVDTGDRELQTQAHSAVGEISWSPVLKTMMDGLTRRACTAAFALDVVLVAIALADRRCGGRRCTRRRGGRLLRRLLGTTDEL